MVDERKRHWLRWASPMIVVGLPLLYVLSYAPALRWKRLDLEPETPIVHIDYYRPVEWLIDKTQGNQPLRWWAGICGAKEDYDLAYWGRQFERGETPDIWAPGSSMAP